MSIKSAKKIFVLPESIFSDEHNADTEVLTAGIYKHVPVEEENDQDIQTNIWEEGEEVESENILYMKGDDPNSKIMRGATLNKLVEKLTPPGTPDLKYLKTFLVTYRSFTTPDVLLEKLIERFNVPDLPTHTNSTISDQEWKSQVLQIKLRVGNVLRQWLADFIYDFNQNMLRKLQLFIDDKLEKDKQLRSVATSLRKNLEKKLLNQESEFDIVFEQDPPYPIVPKKIFTSKLSLFDLDELEIARQFTILNHNVYRKIKPSELLNQAWSKEKLRHRSPNVIEMIQIFNDMSSWVRTSIVIPQRLTQRKDRFVKIVKIAEVSSRPIRILNH